MQHLSNRLVKVLHFEFDGDRRAVELFERFVACRSYSREFFEQLVGVARGNQFDTWKVRRLATLMLQEHLLALDVARIDEFEFVFQRLGIKDRGAALVRESVAKEGYSACDLPGFIKEFRRRLQRPRCAVRPRRGKQVTPADLRHFIHQAGQDCKLALGRYVFTPDEVVARICEQVKLTAGLQLAIDEPFLVREMQQTILDLPDYEAAILRMLRSTATIYWVGDETPSRLNSLVEYPIGTVVLVVKPPGSDVEFELKRAGRRGDHPLSARSHVPPSHRLDGGSMLSALEYEASEVAHFGHIYMGVHQQPAPLSRIVGLLTKALVPLPHGDHTILDYLTDRNLYGDGYDEMRQAMATVVDCFREERGDVVSPFPGDLGLTTQFFGFTSPAQAFICGSSTFRLDLLARYLSPEGPVEYFTRGFHVDYTTEDAKQFAADLLDEVLGIHKPSRVGYESHQQYVDAAFAVPKNRALADAIYLDLHGQIGKMWGTLLGVRGYSFGESFVARNVGLRTVWSQGNWCVRLVFQDHDNLVLPGCDQQEYFPHTALSGSRLDDCFIGSAEDDSETSELSCLRKIYRADDSLAKKAQKQLRKALKRAYVKTHQSINSDPRVRSRFDGNFVERLRDWDAVARKFVSSDGSPNGQSWKHQVRKYLQKRGYSERLIEDYCKALHTYGDFVKKYSFLYRAKIDHA